MPTESKENLPLNNSPKEIVGETKESLSILEKETWVKIFKDASEWIKSLFGFNSKETESSHTNIPSTTHKIDNTKVDTNGFTPGPYPFKHITTPHKGINAYRVDNIKLNPLI